jgi:hypothetical protein
MSVFRDYFTSFSQTASAADFQPQFNTLTGVASIMSHSALSADYPAICNYVRLRLGEPILNVELDNQQIGMAFEEANTAFNRINNTYYVESFFANLLGINRNYTQYDLQSRLPSAEWNIVQRLAGFAKNTARPYVGDRSPRIGYVNMEGGRQNYDIYSEGHDRDASIGLEPYIASVSGQSVEFLNIFHSTPPVFNRYYDPYSSNSLLNSEFGYESYPTETVFYMLPLYQDLARMTTLSLADTVRKSQYRWTLNGRRLGIMPRPKMSFRVWFEYIVHDTSPDLDPILNSSFSGLAYLATSANPMATNLATMPITEMNYRNVNSIGQNWIQKYTLGTAMQMLGNLRSKYSAYPITQTETASMNGGDLTSAGTEMCNNLEEWLNQRLQAQDSTNIIKKEAEKAQAINDVLKFTPLPMMKF